MKTIIVIGAGLAGSEAAWQAAEQGLHVKLYEMRPEKRSPAHHSSEFAELVCSNSFGAHAPDRASGLLQEEMTRLGSLVISTAKEFSVPAGGALAVDRKIFSAAVTRKVESHPLITVERAELSLIPKDAVTVLCTGPLTSESLSQDLLSYTGSDYLSFFDAASPIIEGSSIDRSKAFLGSRYNRGEAAYLNCPMEKDEYLAFYNALIEAEQAPVKDFERENSDFFEGCLPIEELARRGEDTMRYGPLKPVGIFHPEIEGKKYYAVVQLRAEDRHGTLWNMVGFQTNLKWGAQKQVFQMIPGLEHADFVRMGVMHKNTFINAPALLENTLQFSKYPHLFAAGQLTGTEGYAAAVAGGWLAGTNAALYAKGRPMKILPEETMSGSLIKFITSANEKTFQPMPPNFGIVPPSEQKIKGKRNRAIFYSERALNALREWQGNQAHAA